MQTLTLKDLKPITKADKLLNKLMCKHTRVMQNYYGSNDDAYCFDCKEEISLSKENE